VIKQKSKPAQESKTRHQPGSQESPQKSVPAEPAGRSNGMGHTAVGSLVEIIKPKRRRRRRNKKHTDQQAKNIADTPESAEHTIFKR
jgi:ABC-type ATPase with predicted acetyltransferase domain